MILTEEISNKIYDILEDIGASPNMRDSFVHTHVNDEHQHEWRFMGLLGYGGKFWNERLYIDNKYEWRVSCYSEDENPKREKIIQETNYKLLLLSNETNGK